MDKPRLPATPGTCDDDWFPYFEDDGGRLKLSPSWAGEDIWLDEAHEHDDVYPYAAALAYWWAMTQSGQPELAREWADWAEACREYCASKHRED